MKSYYWITFAVALHFSLCACNRCEEQDCSSYMYQEDAQEVYSANPECKDDLDRDSDGIACEKLPSRVGQGPAVGDTDTIPADPGDSIGCPTTANCGCSNKNKAECPGKCCQWIVGTGCKCK